MGHISIKLIIHLFTYIYVYIDFLESRLLNVYYHIIRMHLNLSKNVTHECLWILVFQSHLSMYLSTPSLSPSGLSVMAFRMYYSFPPVGIMKNRWSQLLWFESTIITFMLPKPHFAVYKFYFNSYFLTFTKN